MITAIVYEIFFLAEAVVTQYYNIDLMLQVFFSDLSVLLIVYVFYNLIHRVINRLTDSGKPYAAISIVHWVILSILTAISIAAWAMYVAFRVYYVQGSTRDIFELADNMNKVDSARVILFWVVSLEIFAWVLFATVKAGSHRFTSRVSYEQHERQESLGEADMITVSTLWPHRWKHLLVRPLSYEHRNLHQILPGDQ